MASGGNSFNDFAEVVPTMQRNRNQNREDFFSSVAVGLFLEWAQCYSINIAPTLVAPCQHLWVYCSPRNAQVHAAKQLRTLCVRHQAGTNQQISNVGTKMVILPAVIATTARAWLLLLSAG